MTAGTSTTAYVIVDNPTGSPLAFVGCGPPFAVALTSDTYTPVIGWPACAIAMTIPTGETNYPVMIAAWYNQCGPGPPPAGPECLPDRQPPPLPAGRYEATFFQYTTGVPTPSPIPIKVMPTPTTP